MERETSLNDVTATHQEATVVVEGEKFVFTTAPSIETKPAETQRVDLSSFEPSILRQYVHNEQVIEGKESVLKGRKVYNRVISGTAVLAASGLIAEMETSGEGDVLLEGTIGLVALGFAVLTEKSVRQSSNRTQGEIDQLRERRFKLFNLLKEAKPRRTRAHRASRYRNSEY